MMDLPTKRRRRPHKRGAFRLPEKDFQVIAAMLTALLTPFVDMPPVGLTHQQLRTLCSLDPFEPICVTALADKMGIKKSATSLMVSRLVLLGYVWKERSIEDRRVVLVRLTREGERVKSAPSTINLGRLMAMAVERGFDWIIRFRVFLKRVVSVMFDDDNVYEKLGQLTNPRPVPPPEMRARISPAEARP